MANVTYFNRHESMNSETRELILETIDDLRIMENCPPSKRKIINYLYGAFDGYDYSELVINDPLFESLNAGGNSHLSDTLKGIFDTISKYPRTEDPNNNNF